MKILIADARALLREGIKSVLQTEKDIQISGEADDGEKAIRLIRDLRPDVAVLGLKMPKADAFEIVRRTVSLCKALVIDDEDGGYQAELLQAGAAGYWHKNMPLATLAATIRKTKDSIPLETSTDAQSATRADKKSVLTCREIEILQLLGRGLSNAEIARQLFLSEKTVKNHLTSMFKKLKVSDRTQAVLYALRHHIILL